MGFYQEYELVGLVHDGPVKTLRAKEVATSRTVFLHLLTGALDPDAQESLLEKLRSLAAPASPTGLAAVLKLGEFAGTRYVVTEELEPFTNLQDWASSQEPGTPAPEPSKAGAADPTGVESAGSTAADGADRRLSADSSMLLDLAPQPADGGLTQTNGPAPASPTGSTAGNAGQAAGPESGESPADSPAAPADAPGSGTGQTPRPAAQSHATPAAESAATEAVTTSTTTSTVVEQAPPLSAEVAELAPESTAASSPDAVETEDLTGAVQAVEPATGLRELTESLDAASPSSESAAEGDKEIGKWLDQARQHLDSNDGSRALEALEQVLRLRPNDPEALRLSAEAKRRGQHEREIEQAREGKERRYQAAREHWQRGDVQAAFTELEVLLSLEQRQPDPDSGRRATYEEFHREVRAENDAIREACEEARSKLAEENLEAALAICEQYLAKYPSHPLFQALKFEVSESKRQQLVALIAETDQQVESEPDLDERLSILEQALERYPEEQHFEEALGLAREKRDLVRSVIEQAESFEEEGRFHEALEQWRLVPSIHQRYPGLEVALERLQERLEEQRIQEEAKARWAEQVQRYLESGDYEQAVQLAQDGRAEHPSDTDLQALEEQAVHALEKAGQIKQLVQQAQESFDQGHHDEALDKLRQAHHADEHNAVVREELANSLLTVARNRVESDWEATEPLIEEILKLEPNHPPAVSLLEQVAHQKREELVSWCLVEARHLRTQGDFEAALKAVEGSLERYPEEGRLQQLHANLKRESPHTAKTASRTGDLEQLRGLERELSNVRSPERFLTLTTEVKAIAERHPNDQEIQALASQLAGADADEPAAGEPTAEPPAAGPEVEEPPASGPGGDGAAAAPDGVSGPATESDETSSGPEPTFSDTRGASSPTFLASLQADPARSATVPGPPTGDLEGAASDEAGATLPEDSSSGQPYLESAEFALEPETPANDEPRQEPFRQPFTAAYKVQTEDDLLSRLAAEGEGQVEPPAEEPAPGPQPEAEAPPNQRIASLSQRLQSSVRLPGTTQRWPLSLVLGIGALVFLAAVVAAVAFWNLTQAEPPPAASSGVPVVIQSSPAGATLSIDGEVCGVSECSVELAADVHRAEARLLGYQTGAVSFELSDETPPEQEPVVITLTPFAPLFRISSDLGAGKVTLDGEELGELEDGGFELELVELSPGEHTLEVSNRGSTAAIVFEAAPGSTPEIREPVRTRNLKGVVIAGLGRGALVYSDTPKLAAELDGTELGEIGVEGLSLGDLGPGPHELTLGQGRELRKVVFDGADRPVLAAFLNSDRNVGGLRIATAEDDVTIYLNGRKYRRKTQRGRRLIYLNPKEYIVRVEKAGFETPPEQLAEVRKGEEVRLTFTLEPTPRTSSLRIRNGLPGAEVLLDGKRLGDVRSDGTFAAPNLQPGRHTVGLRKEQYKPKELARNFVAGETVDLDGVLDSAVGTLAIQVGPAEANARITLLPEGETVPQTISDGSLQLPEGNYTVTANAEGYEDDSATVRVPAGQTKTARLTLRPRKKEEPLLPTLVLDDWAAAGGWEREGKLLVRRGGKYVLAPKSTGAGTYAFTAIVRKGRRLEWVVDYSDPQNYVFYQLGKNYFHRTEVTNGKRSKTSKVPHQLKWDDFVSVQIGVSGGSIVHKLLTNRKWKLIERWSHPRATDGRFGFHVPGRDQIALSQFTFLPTR